MGVPVAAGALLAVELGVAPSGMELRRLEQFTNVE